MLADYCSGQVSNSGSDTKYRLPSMLLLKATSMNYGDCLGGAEVLAGL